jgi:hypothetical protein
MYTITFVGNGIICSVFHTRLFYNCTINILFIFSFCCLLLERCYHTCCSLRPKVEYKPTLIIIYLQFTTQVDFEVLLKLVEARLITSIFTNLSKKCKLNLKIIIYSTYRNFRYFWTSLQVPAQIRTDYSEKHLLLLSLPKSPGI